MIPSKVKVVTSRAEQIHCEELPAEGDTKQQSTLETDYL